jgi:hypothetical protein
MRADLLSVGRECGGLRRALGSGAHHDRHPGLDEAAHTLAARLVAQERPLAHRAAVDDAAHASGDQLGRLADEGAMVDRAVRVDWGHDGRQAAAEDRGVHGLTLLEWRGTRLCRGRGSCWSYHVKLMRAPDEGPPDEAAPAYRRRHATYCGTDPSGSGLRYGRPPVAAANSARAAARAVGFVISSNPVSAIALAA